MELFRAGIPVDRSTGHFASCGAVLTSHTLSMAYSAIRFWLGGQGGMAPCRDHARCALLAKKFPGDFFFLGSLFDTRSYTAQNCKPLIPNLCLSLEASTIVRPLGRVIFHHVCEDQCLAAKLSPWAIRLKDRSIVLSARWSPLILLIDTIMARILHCPNEVELPGQPWYGYSRQQPLHHHRTRFRD